MTKVINVAEMKKGQFFKNNTIYLLPEEIRYVNGKKYISKMWKANFECKKEQTAMNRMVKAVAECEWLNNFKPEDCVSEDVDIWMLNKNAFTVEKMGNVIYIAVHALVEVPELNESEEEVEIEKEEIVKATEETKVVRLKKFLVELDETITSETVYDDETQKDVCTMSEKDLYDSLMEKDEYHLLTSKTVKEFIHIFCTDQIARMCVLSGYEIL